MTAKRKTAKKRPTKKKAATKRPIRFHPKKLMPAILTQLADGVPLAVICRQKGNPSRFLVYQWLKEDEDMNLHFAQARDDGYDMIASRLRETARGRGDSAGDVQRDKLIIETDLKLLAKWSPKKYGDKLDIEAKVTGAINVTIGGDV